MKLKTTFIALMMSAVPLLAQTPRLDLRLDHLVDKAEETVEVNLDGAMLRLATQFLSGRDEDQRKLKQAIAGVTGIYVRSFKFNEDEAYTRNEAAKIRAQLDRSWQPIVTVRSKRSDNVDIFVRPGDHGTRGIVIIAAEPREFTVVQVVGEIDLSALHDLEGNFGIPEIEVEVKESRKGDN